MQRQHSCFSLVVDNIRSFFEGFKLKLWSCDLFCFPFHSNSIYSVYPHEEMYNFTRYLSLLGEEKPYGTHHLCWSWVCGCNTNLHCPAFNLVISGIFATSLVKFSCGEHRWHVGPWFGDCAWPLYEAFKLLSLSACWGYVNCTHAAV